MGLTEKIIGKKLTGAKLRSDLKELKRLKAVADYESEVYQQQISEKTDRLREMGESVE